MAKGKSKAVWWILEEQEKDVFTTLYRGQDKTRARDVAAKRLKENPKASVAALRVPRLTVLSVDSLQQSLPKDSF